MNKEYIQLPPLERDLDADVVKTLWEFIKLPDKYKKRYQDQYELLKQKKKKQINSCVRILKKLNWKKCFNMKRQ